MLKVLLVAGTRPEVLKIYPLIKELEIQNIDFKFVSTGQQKELIGQTLESLNIFPDLELNLMRDNQNPSDFVSNAITALGEVISKYLPNYIIVQGDTSSALAGALAGFYAKIPVGHVEAGLRSHDLLAPWPEEGFRRIIDAISTIHWFPTERSVRKLEMDQVGIVTGNTIVDTLRIKSNGAQNNDNSRNKILVTLHRRESFGTTLSQALNEIKKLSETTNYEVVFIQHPNPNIQSAIEGLELHKSSIRIVRPLPYLEFINLLTTVSAIITDSGGLQEEARTLNIPLIVLRDNSERMEAIDGIRFKLSRPDGSDLLTDLSAVLNSDKNLGLTLNQNPFGDGFAATRIVKSLLDRTRENAH
jgi:UDP-N-acetylglucosamine 2-epimerase (non-hydrolysing)